MKWGVVSTAPEQLTAEMWCQILQEEGINALIKPGDAVSFLGVSSSPCRIMVPESELQEAREVLSRYTGQGTEVSDI